MRLNRKWNAGRGQHQPPHQPAIGLIQHQGPKPFPPPPDRGVMQRGKLRVGVKFGPERVAAGGVAQDRLVDLGAEIAFDPVGKVKGRGIAVRAPTVGFQHIAFHRAKRVVVQLHQPVIVLPVGGEDAPFMEQGRQGAARTVEPALGWQAERAGFRKFNRSLSEGDRARLASISGGDRESDRT